MSPIGGRPNAAPRLPLTAACTQSRLEIDLVVGFSRSNFVRRVSVRVWPNAAMQPIGFNVAFR